MFLNQQMYINKIPKYTRTQAKKNTHTNTNTHTHTQTLFYEYFSKASMQWIVWLKQRQQRYESKCSRVSSAPHTHNREETPHVSLATYSSESLSYNTVSTVT